MGASQDMHTIADYLALAVALGLAISVFVVIHGSLAAAAPNFEPVLPAACTAVLAFFALRALDPRLLISAGLLAGLCLVIALNFHRTGRFRSIDARIRDQVRALSQGSFPSPTEGAHGPTLSPPASVTRRYGVNNGEVSSPPPTRASGNLRPLPAFQSALVPLEPFPKASALKRKPSQGAQSSFPSINQKS